MKHDRLRWVRIAVTVLTVSGLACIAALFSLRLPEYNKARSLKINGRENRSVFPYRAVAVLEIRRPDLLKNDTANATVQSSNEDINTYIRILESKRLSHKVIASYTFDELAEIGPPSSKLKPMSFDFRVSFEVDRKKSLLLINVIHPKANAALLIAKRYAEVFLDYAEKWDRDRRQLALGELKKSLARQRAEIANSRIMIEKAERAKDAEARDHLTLLLDKQSRLLELAEEKITEPQHARFALKFDLKDIRAEKIYWPVIFPPRYR